MLKQSQSLHAANPLRSALLIVVPQDTAHVERVVFPYHPYGRPIIGYPESLNAMTPASMRDYYQRFYHPGNATLVVAGDVSRTKAVRAVREHFGAIPAGPDYDAADCFRTELGEPAGAVPLDPSHRLATLLQCQVGFRRRQLALALSEGVAVVGGVDPQQDLAGAHGAASLEGGVDRDHGPVHLGP